MKERRKNTRFKSSTIVQYKEDFFKAYADTLTRNVGLGGVCFFSDKKLRRGKVIKLKLFFDAKSPAKVLKAKVIWSREYHDKVSKGYLNGLSIMR